MLQRSKKVGVGCGTKCDFVTGRSSSQIVNINKKTWYRQTGIVNHEPRSIRSLTVYLITYIVYIIVIILSFLIRQLSLA